MDALLIIALLGLVVAASWIIRQARRKDPLDFLDDNNWWGT